MLQINSEQAIFKILVQAFSPIQYNKGAIIAVSATLRYGSAARRCTKTRDLKWGKILEKADQLHDENSVYCAKGNGTVGG